VTQWQFIDGTLHTFTFDGAGQQTAMAYPAGITTKTYDNAGREHGVINCNSYRLTYTYDQASNRTVMQDPNSLHLTYSYDSQNRLTSIINMFNQFTTMGYDALNRDLTKTHGNGMTVSHAYDPAGRQTALWNLGGDGSGLGIFTATYDPVGNRLTVLEIDGSQQLVNSV
jgi:YD repeat-containing protein